MDTRYQNVIIFIKYLLRLVAKCPALTYMAAVKELGLAVVGWHSQCGYRGELIMKNGFAAV